MLFLFSDFGEDDAPTRIRVGSHADVARLVAPAGEAGLAHLQLGNVGANQDVALATGAAHTVYLCHPFQYTLPRSTEAIARASYPSRLSPQRSRSGWIARTELIRQSRSQSGTRCEASNGVAGGWFG